MKSGSRHSGYTIVEVMVFLAVSSLLLVSALTVVGGQQRKTEFNTAIREFDSKLQNIVNAVANGYYNQAGSINCSADAAGVITVSPAPIGSANIGTQSNCTFVGQQIDMPTGSDRLIVTSLAGLRRRVVPPIRNVQSFSESNPTPMGAGEDYTYTNGVTLQQAKIIVSGQIIDRIVIAPTFSTFDSVTDNLTSGSSRVEVHAINTGSGIDVTNPPRGVQICLQSGNQIGIVVLNNSSTRTSIGSTCP